MDYELKSRRAREVFDTFCKSLDADNWNYRKDEEKLTVIYNQIGKDIKMNCYFSIDTDRQVIRFLSAMPINFSGEKIADAVLACCFINNTIAYGGFDTHLETGEVFYRMSYGFCGCLLGEDFFRRMRSIATMVVDEFNDKFVDLYVGKIRPEEILNRNDNK